MFSVICAPRVWEYGNFNSLYVCMVHVAELTIKQTFWLWPIIMREVFCILVLCSSWYIIFFIFFYNKGCFMTSRYCSVHYKTYKSACLLIIESKSILDHKRKLLQALDDDLKWVLSKNVNYIHFQCSLMLLYLLLFRCILVSIIDILFLMKKHKLFYLNLMLYMSSGRCKPHEIHTLHEEKRSLLIGRHLACRRELAEGKQRFALGVKATFVGDSPRFFVSRSVWKGL